MIAKLAVWGRSREEAIDRLKRALGEYQVTGITTTLPFFRQVVEDDEFKSGRLDTGFISRFNQRQEQTAASGPNTKKTIWQWFAAALEYLKVQRRGSAQAITTTSNRWKMSGRTPH
jgi:acetyl-CoA carboxylase biotin carboxylase subunit